MCDHVGHINDCDDWELEGHEALLVGLTNDRHRLNSAKAFWGCSTTVYGFLTVSEGRVGNLELSVWHIFRIVLWGSHIDFLYWSVSNLSEHTVQSYV